VHNNVYAVVDGSNEVSASTKCVIYDDGHAGLVRNRNDLLEVGDVVFWVSNALELETLSVGITVPGRSKRT
jgi:hypothetical protein